MKMLSQKNVCKRRFFHRRLGMEVYRERVWVSFAQMDDVIARMTQNNPSTVTADGSPVLILGSFRDEN
jgi:hypothetical protein